MNINYITFAQNLQRLMDEKGVDRKKLCDDLSIKYVTVSSWLEARKYPRIDNMDLLARYFNVPVAYLSTKWDSQITSDNLYDEKSAPTAPVQNGLTPRQERIVKLFNELTESQQDNIIGRAELLAEQNENEHFEEDIG